MDEAMDVHRRALKLKPDDAGALSNIGLLYKELGRREEAVEHYRRAIEQTPDDAELLCTFASVLQHGGDSQEVRGLYQRAATLAPESERVQAALGRYYKYAGEIDEARGHFEILSQLAPDDLLRNLRTALLCPTVFESAQAIDAYRSALLDTIADLAARAMTLDLDDLVESGCEPPFNLPFHGQDDLPLKRAHAALFAHRMPSLEAPPPQPGEPRIGFLVTEGHEGIFLKSVVSNINGFSEAAQLVIIGPAGSLERLRQHVTHDKVSYVPLPRGFETIVRTVRSLKLSLLYYHEIGSDSINYFLGFFRLARVQVTGWGIQVSSALPCIDGYVSSRWVEPKEAASQYTERLLLLDSLLKHQPRLETPAPLLERAYFGLKDKAHVYLSAQHVGKFHPDYDQILGEILRGDPEGVIVLTEWPTPTEAAQLMKRIAGNIPDVAERVVMLPHQEQVPYASLVYQADVLLDPFHFGGVNTTYDGLSFGKPVVTLPGPYQRTRFTLGCYRRLGVEDCVASTPEDYVRIATRLGMEPECRAELSGRLSEASEVLFHNPDTPRQLEACFAELIEAPG